MAEKTFVMTEDQSADLSFTLSGQGLCDNTIYYVERCVPDSIKGIYAKDVMRLAISLQVEENKKTEKKGRPRKKPVKIEKEKQTVS